MRMELSHDHAVTVVQYVLCLTRNVCLLLTTISLQVVAKIIKHCHEEGSSAVDVAQGVLLGLVADSRLEVTNCFPFPRSLDDNFDEEDYQMEMMRHLRKVNVDHLHVGWYQSTQQGAFLSTQFLESQFTYQTSIEESVVLIYGTFQHIQIFLLGNTIPK